MIAGWTHRYGEYMTFVVCGEALIDLVPQPGSGATTFQSSWQAQSAGSPMNTAIALARLGAPAQFRGRISTDALGNQIAAHLESNALPAQALVRTDDPTSLAVVSLDDQRRANYTFHFARTANFGWDRAELPDLHPQDWLHLGSLALVVDPSWEVLLDWAAAQQGPISIDMNVRPGVLADPAAYWPRMQAWLEVVGARGGVTKASDEDIAFLAESTNPIEVARGWVREFGLSLAVITFGADGAVAVRPDGAVVSVPGHRVDVVDTIGAGDTFMAAFLSAHGADREDITGALAWAVASSALVCTRSGAQPPTRSEVESYLAGIE